MSSSFRYATLWKRGRFVRVVSRTVVIVLTLIAVLFGGSAWLIGSGVHAASKPRFTIGQETKFWP